MANHLRVTLEIGLKGKRVVAVAPDWPGLERGAMTEAAAVERLRSYIPRYALVTRLAGMEAAFATSPVVDVVEHYPGTGSTDFWGISFAFSGIDQQVVSGEALERELTLMRACWTFFDAVRVRVSAAMQRGPRGGGRDRDHIVRHTLFVEKDWAGGVGVATSDDALLTDEGLRPYRDAYCQAIRDYHAQGKLAGKQAKWPLRYLIRHTAFHTLDHAWEVGRARAAYLWRSQRMIQPRDCCGLTANAYDRACERYRRERIHCLDKPARGRPSDGIPYRASDRQRVGTPSRATPSGASTGHASDRHRAHQRAGGTRSDSIPGRALGRQTWLAG
ncbi:MAG: hypothetical protein IPP13_02860 [Kouleothrix sp.]|nr:hypothetical protein [Kouleothrix sp.]